MITITREMRRLIHTFNVLVHSLTRHPRFFALALSILFIINFLTPLAVQIIFTGNTSVIYGFGDPPKEITYPTPNMEIPRGVLIWYGLEFNDYFLNNNPGFLTGKTYWLVTFSPLTMALILAVSIVSAMVFTIIWFYNKTMKGKCRAEAGTSGLATTLSVVGVSTAASAAVSCPSCGFTALMTVAGVIVSSSTGTLLGVSALYVNLLNSLLVIGIIINIAVMIYVAGKVRI